MIIKNISAPGHGPSQLAEMTRHQNVMAEIDRREIQELHHEPPSEQRPITPKECPSCKGPHPGRGLLCPKCREQIIAQTQHLKP